MIATHFFASIVGLLVVYAGIEVNANCWSTSACIDVNACAAKGGSSKAGLCSGASNIQCCSW